MWNRLIVIFVVVCPFWVSGDTTAACLVPPGDSTQSGAANIADVQCVILAVLWNATGFDGMPSCLGGSPGRADLDCDASITVNDVQLSIMFVLGAPLSPTLDKDADSCVDTCSAKGSVTVAVIGTSGAAVPGAIVTAGGAWAQIQPSGLASIIGVPAGSNVLLATHPDYAPASALIGIPALGSVEHSFVLAPLETYGPFAADAPIVIEHALVRIEIPGGGVVQQDGLPASGPIEVRVATVDPYAAFVDARPGPNIGVAPPIIEPLDIDPAQMVEVELFSGGQPAKLAENVMATLSLPITASVALGKAPGDSMAAWWYDKEAALWRADGAGVLEMDADLGLIWVAPVTHFTWWMGGAVVGPVGCIHVSVTAGAAGGPVAGATVKAVYANGKKHKIRSTDESGSVCLNFGTGGEVTLAGYHTSAGTTSLPLDLAEVAEGEGDCKSNALGCLQVELPLDPQWCVHGELSWPDGAPVADHPVFCSITLPNGGGQLTAHVNTGSDGSFCMATVPGATTHLWSTVIQAGDVFGAQAVVTPVANSGGCGASECTNAGVMILKPRACGSVGTPPGCLCSLSGKAGEVHDCPLCVASAADGLDHAALFSGVVSYDAGRASLANVTTIQCVTQTQCYEVAITSASLPTGHSVSLSPASLKFAKGTLGMVVTPNVSPTAAVSNATTDSAGAVLSGAPVVMTLKIKLTEDIDPNDPVLVCMDQVTALNGEGRKVGAYFLQGLGTTTAPVAVPGGTHTGCPVKAADLNADGKVNVVDVKCSIANLLGLMSGGQVSNCNAGPDPWTVADADCSGGISLTDVYVALVAALGGPLPISLDANSDGCVDRCEAD